MIQGRWADVKEQDGGGAGGGDRTRDPSVTDTHTATPGGPSLSQLLDHKMYGLITGKTFAVFLPLPVIVMHMHSLCNGKRF